MTADPKTALKDHALSFETVDDLWRHLFEEHGRDARGDMVVLDRLHLAAHRESA